MSSDTLQIASLHSTLEVVAFCIFLGIAWFNGAELLFTILFTFRKWTGRYFYCFIIATLGVLTYTITVFLMIFGKNLNFYAIATCSPIGWAAMVTGQSLVLWSRLHLVCQSRGRMKAIFCMIIVNAICLHIPQGAFSLAAVRNETIDATYKPFEYMEKISVSIFTTQELVISSVYIYEAVQILRAGEVVRKQENRRRIQQLFLANIVICCIDIMTIALEFTAVWGIWSSFKGFGYSVKLKIEFVILNQLRDSVRRPSLDRSYGMPGPIQSMPRSSCTKEDFERCISLKPMESTLDGLPFDGQNGDGQIMKTTQLSIQYIGPGNAQSETGSSTQIVPMVLFPSNPHFSYPPSKASSQNSIYGERG